MSAFKMLGDRVAIERTMLSGAEDNSSLVKSESGVLFLMPKTVEVNLPGEGTIVACGPGLHNLKNGELIPMQTKVGDKVLFPRTAGSVEKINGKEYLVMRDTEITCIITNFPDQPEN